MTPGSLTSRRGFCAMRGDKATAVAATSASEKRMERLGAGIVAGARDDDVGIARICDATRRANKSRDKWSLDDRGARSHSSFRRSKGDAVAEKARGDVLQGTLDMLVLKSLQLGPMHGWGITERLDSGSERVLQVGQGSLYPALYRLERQGYIASEWASPRTIVRRGFTSSRVRVGSVWPKSAQPGLGSHVRWISCFRWGRDDGIAPPRARASPARHGAAEGHGAPPRCGDAVPHRHADRPADAG